MANQSFHGHAPASRPTVQGSKGEQDIAKGFDQPDEVRTFAKGKLELVNCGSVQVGRGTFEPGWRWTESVKAIAGTDLCEASHTGYCISGIMHIRMRDGREMDVHAGEAFTLSPGHDAWTIGTEPCVVVDFTGFRDYAKPS